MSEALQQKRQGYVRQAWLVILLALCYGGALAGVETTLGPKIDENKKNETYDVIPRLVSGAEKSRTVEMLLTGATGDEKKVYKAVGSGGEHLGWVLPAGGQGFADRIEVLVGLDPTASTITGLYVLDQKETPGLGDYIAGIDFRGRFENTPTDRKLEIVKGDPTAPHEVRAITGATISSQSVADIVNRAIAAFKEPIRQAASGSPESG